MNILQLLVSINKISLVAFVITIGFLAYEIIQLKKEKEKKDTPNIPKFNESLNIPPLEISGQLVKEQKFVGRSSYHRILIVFLVIMLVFLAGLSFYNSKTPPVISNKNIDKQPGVVLKKPQSDGIKLFDSQWNGISGSTLNNIQPGDTIIIALQSIKELDIDKARIKVNKLDWSEDDITNLFDQKNNVYYKEYIVASDESKLTIDGQLHSKTKGWLTD